MVPIARFEVGAGNGVSRPFEEERRDVQRYVEWAEHAAPEDAQHMTHGV